jgi:hypothetical protein
MNTDLSAERDLSSRGSHARLSLIWRPVLAAISLLLLTACSTLQPPELDQASFQGMSALASAATEERPLEVLIIHGIGTPAPYQFEGFIQSIAQRLRLAQVPSGPSEPESSGCYSTDPALPALIHPAPRPISITGVPDEDRAELYTYRFGPSADGPVTLKVNYLLWAPLTEGIKCKLARDDIRAPSKQAFAAFARDFIDNKLGDVVLYGGTFRDNVMRPSVQAAFCLVTGGTPSPDGKTCASGPYSNPTVIITHSLGGYMLMDAIDYELRKERCDKGAGSTAASKILANTDYIYMMANQIALLDLSRLHTYPRRPAGALPQLQSEDTLPGSEIATQFAKCWTATPPKPRPRFDTNGVEAPPAEKQIVAFSDPNDILSWRLRQKDLGVPRSDRRSVKLTNVYMSNGEFSIPGLISDPVKAHTGYFDNPTVMNLLLCGATNSAVDPCPPNIAP